MDSLDVSHVPPPNAEYFWQFKMGRVFVIAIKPFIDLRVIRIRPGSDQPVGLPGRRVPECGFRPVAVKVEMRHGTDRHVVKDWLNLDKPCVAFRSSSGEPYLTFTLRKVEGDVAFLQVTANPKVSKVYPADVRDDT